MALIKKVEIDIGVKGDAASKAKLDGITAKAEELKKAFPEYALKIDSAAATERIKVFKDELHSIPNETTAKVKVKVDSSALNKLSDSGFFKPSLLGSAVALSPALIPLAGSIAAGVGAIGVSFGAAALGAGLFGLAAKSVLTEAAANVKKLSTLNLAVAKATTAAQKKSALAALDAFKSTFAPGYLAFLGQLETFQGRWRKISQTIAIPALTAWLGALVKGLPLLRTAVKPVADVFQLWGQILKDNFSNPAVMRNLQGMAAAFGKFSASQLTLVGGAIADIALGVFHLGKDLAGSGANFSSFGIWVNNMGAAFLTWSKSGKARADVQGFLHYLHTEGPVVGGILSNLGKILPGIFAGATTTGNLELQAIGGLLSLVAKLPKGWQAPLTEAAGAILLLSKTGVLKVGFTVVGAAAGWVKKLLGGGASVDIGGTAAAAEMRAAMVSGGAAAAAEIRAAMTGGTATGAGAGAGAGGAAGAAGRFGLPSLGTLATYAAGAGGIVGGLFLRIREDAAGGFAGIGRDIPKALSGTTGFLQIAASGWSDTIVGRFEKPVRALFVRVEHNIANAFDIIRHAVSTRWDAIWSQSIAQVRGGISTVVGWFRGLPGRAVGALFGLGHSLAAFASAAIGQMWTAFRNTFSSVIHWFQGLPSKILHALGVHSPPGWAVSAGKWIMKGLHIGLGHGLGQLTSFTTSIGAQVAGALSGALGGHMGDSGARTHSAAVAQAYARSLLSQYGWSANQMSSLIPLWNQESGWSAYAVNQSSGAYGIPQSLGHGHPYNLGDYKNQIVWGLNYIRGRYGSPAAAERHELAYNWYDKGGWLMPGLTLAMNKTGRPEQILPPGGGSGGVVRHIFEIRAPHGATQLERAVAEMIRHVVTVNGGDVQSALGRT